MAKKYMFEIMAAKPAHTGAIAAIWNQIIRDTSITFNSVEKTNDDIANMIAVGQSTCLVALNGQKVIGFAFHNQFRPGIGYRHTHEHSIHLAPAARGKGIGSALLAALETAARKAQVHSLMAAISANNAAAIRFHKANGFVQVGHLPEQGRKFDQWLDLVLMQKLL